MENRDAEFAEKVRVLYLEHFGEDAFSVIEGDEPAVIGTVLVLMEAQHLDGETSFTALYDGSYNAAIGMAARFSHGSQEDE